VRCVQARNRARGCGSFHRRGEDVRRDEAVDAQPDSGLHGCSADFRSVCRTAGCSSGTSGDVVGDANGALREGGESYRLSGPVITASQAGHHARPRRAGRDRPRAWAASVQPSTVSPACMARGSSLAELPRAVSTLGDGGREGRPGGGGSRSPSSARGAAAERSARDPRRARDGAPDPGRERVSRSAIVEPHSADRRCSSRGGSSATSRTSSAASKACPHQYLKQLRLARALVELPHAGDLTALSFDLGFSSHSHFSYAFRRAFGCHPRNSGNARASSERTMPLDPHAPKIKRCSKH
jgi:AraC-like DNA-binding protein